MPSYAMPAMPAMPAMRGSLPRGCWCCVEFAGPASLVWPERMGLTRFGCAGVTVGSGAPGTNGANKKAPRAGEVASRRSRSEHRGSCSQFLAELIATAHLSSSKGCAKLISSIKTTIYVTSETVCAATRIVRFGRKAACQVSWRINVATLARRPGTVFSTCRKEYAPQPRQPPVPAAGTDDPSQC